MTKFISSVAVATLIISFFTFHSYAQNSNGIDIGFDSSKKLSEAFNNRYRKGTFHKRPTGYMIKFSKQDLIKLIESVPDVESINIVLGSVKLDNSFSKKSEGPKLKPLLIFQFKTLPSPNFLNGEYIYKVAGSLCPPPLTGCKVEETPAQN